jgi:hypothetical protein
MSFGWLARTVSGGGSFGVRRRVAGLARRELSEEIDERVLPVLRMWRRDLIRHPDEDAQPVRTVIAWIEADARPEVSAWLAGGGPALDTRTDWLFFPAAPEAVLIAAVGEETPGVEPFRFNLRIAADPYRRHLERLAKIGVLGLTAVPLDVGPAREILSPCVFLPIPAEALRQFLRELPAPPVV